MKIVFSFLYGDGRSSEAKKDRPGRDSAETYRVLSTGNREIRRAYSFSTVIRGTVTLPHFPTGRNGEEPRSLRNRAVTAVETHERREQRGRPCPTSTRNRLTAASPTEPTASDGAWPLRRASHARVLIQEAFIVGVLYSVDRKPLHQLGGPHLTLRDGRTETGLYKSGSPNEDPRPRSLSFPASLILSLSQ